MGCAPGGPGSVGPMPHRLCEWRLLNPLVHPQSLPSLKNSRRHAMTLRDKAALGISLPHRSPDPLALTTIGTVARRAEELGFRDLWVTENTVDEGTCLDPVVALTFAASITKRIGVGAAVIVLPIHHPLTVANRWISSVADV